jgi:hypothetical protein
VLKSVTKGREILVHGRLALSTFSKEVNGVKVEVTKPVNQVDELSSLRACAKKARGGIQ